MKTPKRSKSRSAHTLLELMVAMVGSAALLAGLAATIFIAVRATDTSRPTARALDAARIVSQIVNELEFAVHVVEHTDHAIQFVVADRNGDGKKDALRYEWSGTPGDPLTLQFNHGVAQSIVDDVRSFQLDYHTRRQTEDVTKFVESDERLLASHVLIEESTRSSIRSLQWNGQYIDPQNINPPLPSTAVSWSVSKVGFRAGSDDARTGSFWVQVRSATGAKTPTSTVLGETLYYEADLSPSSDDWEFAVFEPPAAGLSPYEGVCLVYQWDSGTVAARVLIDGESYGDYLYTTNGGASWNVDADRQSVYQLFGRYTYPVDVSFARDYLTAVNVALQLGEAGPIVRQFVPITNTPELLAQLWEVDFDSDPTALDENGDGSPDWTTHDGSAFNTNELSQSVWTSSAGLALDTTPGEDFRGLTTVTFRCRHAAGGGAGAAVRINADWDAGEYVPLFAHLTRQPDGRQTFSLQTEENGAMATLVTVTDLPDRVIEVRIVIDPTQDVVHLMVDGMNVGGYDYPKQPQSHSDRFASLWSDGGTAEFDYLSIRVSEVN